MAINISTQTFDRHNREIITTAEAENIENDPSTSQILVYKTENIEREQKYDVREQSE